MTYISNADTNRFSKGFVADQINFESVLEIFRTSSTRDASIAGVRESNFIRGQTGVWLFRQIPEPSTIVLITTFLLLLILHNGERAWRKIERAQNGLAGILFFTDRIQKVRHGDAAAMMEGKGYGGGAFSIVEEE